MSAPGPARAARAQVTETSSRAARPAVAPLGRLHAALGNQAVARLLAGQVIRHSPGAPLEAAARADLEERFGADLGSVRVHDDPAACEAVGAVAYTIGEHIVLGGTAGRGLLAHEIAHVLQQRPDASGSAPARLEGEARRAAESGDAPVTVRERGRVGLARQADPDLPQDGTGVTNYQDARTVVSVDGVPVFEYMAMDGPTPVVWDVKPVKGESLTIVVKRDPNAAPKFRFDRAGLAYLQAHGYQSLNVTYDDTFRISEPGELAIPHLAQPVKPRTPPQPAPRRASTKTKPPVRKQPPKKPPAAAPDLSAQAADQAPAPLPPPLPALPQLPAAASPELPAASLPLAAASPPTPAASPPTPAASPPTPTASPPTPQLPATSGEELVDEFSHWFIIDDEGLGVRLAEYARQGTYSVVDEALDEVRSTKRDDLSLAMVSVMSDPDLAAMLKTPEGKALNLRLYDELTSGHLAEDEAAQAERLLKARYRTVDPMATVNPAMRVIPFESAGFTKFDSASLTVRRLDDGRISVRSYMAGSSDVAYARNLSPGFVAGLPEVFDPDEIIGVYLVDDDRLIQVPAMFLLQLGNQADTHVLTMGAEAFAAGLTLGLAAPEMGAADVAVESAGTETLASRILAIAGRAVTWADRLAQAVGVAGILINDHRGLIIRTFGDDGREGLEIWSKIETVTAVYGAGRGLVAMGQLAVGMRSSLAKWRALRAAAKDLAADDLQTLDATIAEADKALQQIDDAAQEQHAGLSGPAANDNAEVPRSGTAANDNAGVPRSGTAANDNAEVPPPPRPPVAAQRPLIRMDEIKVVGQVANENEEALALASGDRPRASLGGGSRGGGSRGGGGGTKPATPPTSPQAATPATPSGPPKAVGPIVRRKGTTPSPPSTPLGSKGVGSSLSLTEEEEELSAVEQHFREGGELPYASGDQPAEVPPEMQVHDLVEEGGLRIDTKGIQPPHLPEGTVAEEIEKLKRGLDLKGKTTWRPEAKDIKSPLFKAMVGEPKYTKKGKELVGVILDGPGLEIKSGSSVLDTTYQLRLMAYRAVISEEPLTIVTSRPVASAFREWLTHYGVKITGFTK